MKILSLTPLGAELDGGFRGALVRIQRSLLDKRTGTSQFLDNQLVTLRFVYRKDLALSEQDRVLNPLGFQVTEYRADNDYARGVPVPDEDTTMGDEAGMETSPMQSSGQGVAPDAAAPMQDAAAGQMPAATRAPGTQNIDTNVSTGTAEGVGNR